MRDELTKSFWPLFPSCVGFYLLFSLWNYSFTKPTNQGAFWLIGKLRLPVFSDLKWLLSFSACPGEIYDLVISKISCNGYPDPRYPALSMEIGRWLGLGPSDAHWIGVASGVAISVVLAHVCWLYTANIRSWSIITGLLALSFPYQLLLERGNLDGLIFLLIALFCLLVWLPGWRSLLLANATGAFAVSLKIYPILAIGAWLFLLPKDALAIRNKRAWFLSLLMTGAASLVIGIQTLYSGFEAASGSLISHGLTAKNYAYLFLTGEFGRALGSQLNDLQMPLKFLSILFGFICGLAFGGKICLPPTRAASDHQLLLHRYAITLAMVASAAGIGCYIASIGYDYRFILLTPMLALLLANLLGNSSFSRIERIFLISLVAASVYVFFLPYAESLPLKTLKTLELLDETFLAPFFLAGTGGIWMNLQGRLHSELFQIHSSSTASTVAVATHRRSPQRREWALTTAPGRR